MTAATRLLAEVMKMKAGMMTLILLKVMKLTR